MVKHYDVEYYTRQLTIIKTRLASLLPDAHVARTQAGYFITYYENKIKRAQR